MSMLVLENSLLARLQSVSSEQRGSLGCKSPTDKEEKALQVCDESSPKQEFTRGTLALPEAFVIDAAHNNKCAVS